MKKNDFLKFIFCFMLLVLPNSIFGQLSVTTANTDFTISFDATVAGVTNGAYAGSGFNPTPTAGLLDGNAWEITGFGTNHAYDATSTSGDMARGTSSGGASTGGLYAFDVGGGDIVFGIQPGGSDFTPGTITLKVTNNTGVTVNGLELDYLVWIYNDQGRANSFNFSYSTDDATYTPIASLNVTSTETADGGPAWASNARNTTISGLSIADGSTIYLRWTGDDVSGSGSRDEFGLDDIVVKMNPVTTWDGSTDTDWATADNWSDGVPTLGHNVVIPDLTNDPVIGATTGAAVNDITITNGVLSITAGGSLIVGGTSTGDFTYNVAVADTNWHLISAPVVGEQYDDAWNTANSINVSGTGLNDGVSTYDNTTDANGNWDYFQTGGAATTFNSAQGYSLLRTAAGTYGFTGTMRTTDATPTITANDIGGGGENRWTLIGNPFPSYINISDFLTLTANATALTDTHESVYVWNGTAYVALTTGHIHPGQGFFVNSNVASTSVAINENMLSHQTGITFYRNPSTEPSIELTLTDGQKTRTTEIRYTSGKTTGLDPRFDIGTFTGTSNSFHVYTHLITDSQGVNFMRQTLPDANHESMIVPVGVNASSGDEITFTATALNIPNGLNVFIEDKDTNTFTRLDDTNAEYTVTLSSDLNGIGRFYLHTNTQQALDVDSFDLNSISIYKTNDVTLRVAGLRNGNASLKIFDVLGKQVLQTNFEANGINDIALPNFKSGVYIIQLQTNNGNLNKKIIIE